MYEFVVHKEAPTPSRDKIAATMNTLGSSEHSNSI